MKETYMRMIVACVLLFSGCASQEQTESAKESTSKNIEQTPTQEKAPSTSSENLFTSTTHEHNPEKICSYSADAFSACAEKKDNESCEYDMNGTIVSAKCATEPCGKLVCKSA